MSIQNYFPAGAQKTPAISVTTAGLITATAGNKSATHTLSSSDDADFIAANILSGKTIFGLAGSLVKGGAYATGTVTSGTATTTFVYAGGGTYTGLYAATLTGLGFTPRMVILERTDGSYTRWTICFPQDVVGSSNYARIFCMGPDSDITLSNGGSTPMVMPFRLTGNAYLTSGGFSLPVNLANIAYIYHAFE